MTGKLVAPLIHGDAAIHGHGLHGSTAFARTGHQLLARKARYGYRQASPDAVRIGAGFQWCRIFVGQLPGNAAVCRGTNVSQLTLCRSSLSEGPALGTQRVAIRTDAQLFYLGLSLGFGSGPSRYHGPNSHVGHRPAVHRAAAVGAALHGEWLASESSQGKIVGFAIPCVCPETTRPIAFLVKNGELRTEAV